MRQLKKASSSIATLFPAVQAPRPSEILLACLHGAEAMTAYVLRGPVSRVGGSQHADPYGPPGPHPSILNSHSSRSYHTSLASRIQASLETKFARILKQFLRSNGESLFVPRAGLTRTARLREAGLRIAEYKSTDKQQTLRKRVDSLERELADAETSMEDGRDWVPLVKASATSSAVSIATRTPDFNTPRNVPADRDACNETQKESCTGFDLAGRCILCVGGRAKLYPEYRRLVETSGGCLLIYRSGLSNDANILPTLFARADMVVCPADCVNHNAYFAVKRYCKRSGKACVLLDRSNVPTFRKGVETLAALAASR